MRAPRECASWFWNLDGEVEPGPESALRTAGRMSAILQKHALLEPDALEWNWFQVGKGGLGIHSRLNLVGCSLEDQALPDGLRSCRPNGHPLAEMGGILVLGSGTRSEVRAGQAPQEAAQRRGRQGKGSRGGMPSGFDEKRYRKRSTVERATNRLQQHRAVAIRYDKRQYVQACPSPPPQTR